MSVEIDPSVIFSQDENYEKRIDNGYDIKLFQSEEKFNLYDTKTYEQKIFSDPKTHSLEFDSKEIKSLFEKPVTYQEVKVNNINGVAYVLYVLILIQCIVIVYIIYRFIIKKRGKNATN